MSATNQTDALTLQRMQSLERRVQVLEREMLIISRDQIAADKWTRELEHRIAALEAAFKLDRR